ncbi:hypothetical protein Tco_0828178 [Tanacetum coccineum]
MAHDRAGTSGNPHVDNIKTTDEHVDACSCIRNVVVQTGEEFSPEFLRKPRLGLPTTNKEPFYGLPIEVEKNAYPNVASRYEQNACYRHVSSVSEGSYFGKLKFNAVLVEEYCQDQVTGSLDIWEGLLGFYQLIRILIIGNL